MKWWFIQLVSYRKVLLKWVEHCETIMVMSIRWNEIWNDLQGEGYTNSAQLLCLITNYCCTSIVQSIITSEYIKELDIERHEKHFWMNQNNNPFHCK